MIKMAKFNPLTKKGIRTEFELQWFVESETYANSSLNE